MAPGVTIVKQLLVLIPVYNDWGAVGMLIPRLDAALDGVAERVHLLLVDDGSTLDLPPDFGEVDCRHIDAVDILALRRNVGHQRAIALGLAYVSENCSCDAVLVMDGDGEDDPADVPRLVSRFREDGGTRIVFAERRRRSETLTFRMFYHLYRFLHFLLTGRGVKVGNFSLIPQGLLQRLVVVSELWNHYAASVFKARLPYTMVHTRRATRLCEGSRMDFVALVTHGLSAVSVYSDLVGVRLLILFGTLSLLTLVSSLGILGLWLVCPACVSTWAALISAVLMIVFFQTGMFALLACFITLGSRAVSVFLPLRDYKYYISGTRSVLSPGSKTV